MPKKVKKKTKCGRHVEPSISHDSQNNARDSESCKHINVTYRESPVKPDVDKAEYRTITLPNGLTALLASLPTNHSDDEKENVEDVKKVDASGDKEPEKSNFLDKFADHEETSVVGCSLAINVGYFNDPPRVPGLAHLLTTIVPSWSKKYPLPKDVFADKVLRPVVYCYAETSVTVFRAYKVSLRQSLDYFTQCYIKPLIRRDMVAASLQEFGENTPNGASTPNYVKALASLASDWHPIKVFNDNNIEKIDVLSVDRVYRELLKFRERHHSANRMNFYIRGELPLDDLEEMVKTYFSAIPSNGLQPTVFSPQYNFQNSFNGPTQITTNDSLSSPIHVMWPLPPSQWLYKSCPITYIARILNCRGEGSLVGYLIKKNLCTDVKCGIVPRFVKITEDTNGFHDNSMYTLLSLSVILTEQGRDNYKLVLDAVYSYIDMMRREGPQNRIWNDMQKQEKVVFRFERSDEFSDEKLRDVSIAMHRFPPLDYLTADDSFHVYDPYFIKACTELMTPERAHIVISDYPTKTSSVGPSYKIEKLRDDWLESLKNAKATPEFKLPQTVAYPSDDLAPISMPENSPLYPFKIHSDDFSEIWYKLDANEPHCYVNLLYANRLPLASAVNTVMMDVFAATLEHVISDDLFIAIPLLHPQLNECVVSGRETGLEFRIRCPSQATQIVLHEISTAMKDCRQWLTERMFDGIKKIYLAEYRDAVKCGKMKIDDFRGSMERVVHWNISDRRDALSGCEYGKFIEFCEQFTSHYHVTCLVWGNITQADGLKYAKTLNCGSPFLDGIPKIEIKEISRGQRTFRIEVDGGENIYWLPVKNYYYFYDRSIQLSVVCEIFKMIIASPEFRKLRESIELPNSKFVMETHSDGRLLGYMIQCSYSTLTFVKTEDIDRSIEQVRKAIDAMAKNLTDEEWLAMKRIVRKLMDKFDDDPRIEVSGQWHEMMTGEYIFDRHARKIKALMDLEADDMRKFMTILTTDGPEMRKLSFQVSLQITDRLFDGK